MRSVRLISLLPLLLAALTGCGHEDSPSQPSSNDPLRTAGILSSEGPADVSGRILLADGPDWTGWKIVRRNRTWVDSDGKWLDFQPHGNIAYSPEFEGARRLRVTFELFLPPRFPIFSSPAGALTELFGLHANLGAAASPSDLRLCIKLESDLGWLVEATGRTIDGQTFSSGDLLRTRWLFMHGWNRVDWTIVLDEPGSSRDMMRLQVGDRIFAWSGLDLGRTADAFRFFRLGHWNLQNGSGEIAIRELQIEEVEVETPPPPPPPPPPAGTVLYEQSFEEPDPFAGWLGRRTGTNLQVGEESGNRYGKLLFQPHADWRTSFLPRYQGVFDLRIEFAYRQPLGFRHKRYPAGHPRAGQIMGGGKHIFQISNVNSYQHGRDAIHRDGWCRLDFGTTTEDGPWECVAYRLSPGGERHREIKQRYEAGNWIQNGRWHQVRIDVHLNPGPDEGTGTCEMWVDGDHKGTLETRINVVGPTGGIRVFGFGNLDNTEGEPWVEIDNLRITAL
jgi:hypothetical protein